MKILVIFLLICSVCFTQQLPDAPSTQMDKQTQPELWSLPPVRVPNKRPLTRKQKIIIGVIVTGGIAGGVAIGLATKGVHCSATVYEGKPYNGTSPGCPKGGETR